MAKAVFCLLDSERQAERIVDRLRARGFSSHDISVLFPDDSNSRDFATRPRARVPKGAAAGLGSGAAVKVASDSRHSEAVPVTPVATGG